MGTEFIWEAASAFCTAPSATAGSGLASVVAGRALIVTGTGRRALPIS